MTLSSAIIQGVFRKSLTSPSGLFAIFWERVGVRRGGLLGYGGIGSGFGAGAIWLGLIRGVYAGADARRRGGLGVSDDVAIALDIWFARSRRGVSGSVPVGVGNPPSGRVVVSCPGGSFGPGLDSVWK